MKKGFLKLPVLLLPALLLFLFSFSVDAQTRIKHSLELSYGTIDRLQFDFIGERNVDVWLPEDYSLSNKYSVLYMHDGQMLFDSTATWNKKSWHVDRTIQQLINNGQIENVIVVGIWNSPERHSEYFPQKAISYIPESQRTELLKYMPEGPQADNYLKFIVEELKPFIDKTYPTQDSNSHTFIAGSSMGALISLYAICEYPEIFGGAGCISSHWIGTLKYNEQIPEAINAYLKTALPSPETHKIYFDYGTVGLDANYTKFQQIMDLTLKQKNYDERNTISLEFTGDDHNEDFWAARFSHLPLFLMNKKY